ncbi:EamA family transporter [archaeon]|nr:EamA family transporter [archaeon]
MLEFVGIFMSITAAILFGMAIILQKHSMKKMEKFSVLKLLRNGTWIISILISAAGILFYLAAIRFYSVSSVQPIVTLATVIPVIVGPLVFKEKLSGEKWLAILLVIIGIMAVIY